MTTNPTPTTDATLEAHLTADGWLVIAHDVKAVDGEMLTGTADDAADQLTELLTVAGLRLVSIAISEERIVMAVTS